MTIGAYSTAPMLAWSGWRLRIPGGPQGGQYHGYIASDDIVDGYGWPAGHDEIYRPIDNRQNLGIYPWHKWDSGWHGTPLREGETVSDMVYRSPAELRPRPNASGGINVVRGVQQQRTPGYAVAPGNYRTLGAVMQTSGPPICPSWGCGGPRTPLSIQYLPPVSPAPSPTVSQPPPPSSAQPSPTIPIGPAGANGCAVGQYRDAAGNCVSDWRYPFPMTLPIDTAPGPSPTVAASTCPTGYVHDAFGNCLNPESVGPGGATGVCPTGYTSDQYGNCVVAGVVPSGGVTGWFAETTSLFGMNVPNIVLAGGLLFLVMKGMHK